MKLLLENVQHFYQFKLFENDNYFKSQVRLLIMPFWLKPITT